MKRAVDAAFRPGRSLLTGSVRAELEEEVWPGTGRLVRVPMYVVMDAKVRRLLDASTEAIFAAAVEQGMTTMRDEGVRLCLEGVSSLEEICRVTGDRVG